MDVEWCRDRLQQYLDAVRAFEASSKSDGPEQREMYQRYPTAQAILRSLDSQLDLDEKESFWVIKSLVNKGLGMLEDRAELSRALAPDPPVLAADRMHPWVWEAARPLWEIGQFRQALLAASTSINAHLQMMVDRRDVSDDKLINECFSEKEVEPGKPRVWAPGDPTDQTVRSLQRGIHQLGLACFWAIRNPAAHLASHQAGELNEQQALEQLATLSTLARFLDRCGVEFCD